MDDKKCCANCLNIGNRLSINICRKILLSLDLPEISSVKILEPENFYCSFFINNTDETKS